MSVPGSGSIDGVGYVTNKGSGDGCITGSERTSGEVSGGVLAIAIGLAGIGSVTGAKTVSSVVIGCGKVIRLGGSEHGGLGCGQGEGCG